MSIYACNAEETENSVSGLFALIFFFFWPYIKIMQGKGAKVNKMKETYYHKIC